MCLQSLCGLGFYIGTEIGVAALILSVVVIWLFILFTILRRIKLQKLVISELKNNENLSTYVNTAIIPTALTSLSGKVLWCNLAFRDIGGYGAVAAVGKMIEGIDVPDKDLMVQIKGRFYKKELFSVKFKKRQMLIYRLVDTEETVKTSDLYQNYLGVTCYVQIDNYDELSTEISQSELSDIAAKTEQKIADFANQINASFTKIGRNKYLCLFERRNLPALRASKFPILDEVRKLKKTMFPTLSIAIGVGETPAQSAEFANRAMELALGRGGDQVVIKQGDKFQFFGGSVKTSSTRSKVKSRMISRSLRNLMEQCSDVFIMGHVKPDLDCMGAALGLCACARQAEKKVSCGCRKPESFYFCRCWRGWRKRSNIKTL